MGWGIGGWGAVLSGLGFALWERGRLARKAALGRGGRPSLRKGFVACRFGLGFGEARLFAGFWIPAFAGMTG